MKFVPKPDQIEAKGLLHGHRRCALWMPMGGGKTVTTLSAMVEQHDFAYDDVFPALVLAPLRVAKTVWGPETEKWDHLNHLRYTIVTGSAKERDRALDRDADLFCMNYDNLVWLVDSMGKDWPFKTVIADELTRLKSFRLRQGSKRARALGSVAFTEVTRFWGLTGTPRPNGLKDLWGQLWFIDQGNRLGRTYTSFTERWFEKGYDGFSLEPMPHAEQEIIDKIKDVCFTIESEEVDEPIFNEIPVILPPNVMRLYKDMEKEMFTTIEKEGFSAANAAVRTGKCLQIANGALYLDADEDRPELKGQWQEIHEEKLDALASVIEEANGAPVLVAYNFKHDLARIKKKFPKARVLDANPKTITDWNAGKIQILLAHPASAGHGLNLAQGGNILVFFGVDWNLELFEQIIERIGPRRQMQAGLKRPVHVHLILAKGTADYMVWDRLQGKGSAQQLMLAALTAWKAMKGRPQTIAA